MASRDLPFMPVWIGFNLGAAREEAKRAPSTGIDWTRQA